MTNSVYFNTRYQKNLSLLPEINRELRLKVHTDRGNFDYKRG